MTIAVVAALDVEAERLTSRLVRTNTSAGIAIWEGEMAGDPFVVVVCGVGKVAAAMATQFLCVSVRPQCVISIGLAGGVGNIDERGRLIVATGAVQHDFDARPIATGRGVMPGAEGPEFSADASLAGRLREAALSVVDRKEAVGSGVVLTGDQIITSRQIRDGLLAEFPQGACFDMETAAVAQVAMQNRVPWGGLRITSDSADEEFHLDTVLGFGADTAAELFERVLVRLGGEPA